MELFEDMSQVSTFDSKEETSTPKIRTEKVRKKVKA